MSSFRRIFALALLVLWWPATLHCRIEVLPGAEMIACPEACHDAGADHADRDVHDSCDLFENGYYKASSRTLQVAPPLAGLEANGPLWPSPELIPETGVILSTEQRARLREWVPTWHFTRRAAPAPRAPSGTMV